jgi:hypothetical protein
VTNLHTENHGNGNNGGGNDNDDIDGGNEYNGGVGHGTDGVGDNSDWNNMDDSISDGIDNGGVSSNNGEDSTSSGGSDDVGERSDDSEDGGDGGNSSDGSDHGDDEMHAEMQKCILRILNAKVKYGWSHEETLSQLQNLYEYTENNNIPHKTWSAVMKFLRQLGYKNPRHYKICCGIDCVTLVSGTKCPNCDKLRDKCTDYFVLGLNVESVFSSVSKIHDHMAHWEERDNWFNIEDITVPYKEVWHGSRFRDLSMFWDEERESCLPTCCPICLKLLV